MSNLDPSARRGNRFTKATALLMGVAALAGCGSNGHTPNVIDSTGVRNVEAQNTARGFAFFIEKVSKLAVAQRRYVTIPEACSAPDDCTKPTPQDLRAEKLANSQDFIINLQPSQSKNVGQNNFMRFSVAQTSPAGQKDIDSTTEIFLQSSTLRPYTSGSFFMAPDSQLGGWDVEVDYFDVQSHEFDRNYNTNITVPTKTAIGEFFPITQSWFSTLTVNAMQQLILPYERAGALPPITIPTLHGPEPENTPNQ